MKSLRRRSVRFGLFAATLWIILAGTASSQSKVGTTAAQFLGIAVGPRAIAMGGASVASSEDVSSLYWNPGAFAQAGKSQLMFTNTQWLVGTKFRWLGLMYNLDGSNAVGVSLTQLDYGDDEVTTTTSPEGTGLRWSAQDIAIAISYARLLTDKFSLGGTAKYVSQSIWNESASSFTFDLGLLYVTEFSGLRLGMSMSNFGGDLTMDGQDLYYRVDIDPNNPGGNKTLVAKLKTDAWPMPLLFRVGVAMDIVKTSEVRLTLAGDAQHPIDNVETVNLGSEVGWHDMLFLRAGYMSLFDPNSEEGITLGAGLKYSLEGGGSLELNYAFNKFGVFDNINTIGLAIGF